MKPAALAAGPHPPIVLIIDDDPLFARSLARLLREHGYATIAYDSLAQLSAASDLPQLGCAILDLNLGDSDGLEIQRRLKKLAPALAVLFLTGFGRVAPGVGAMKAGALDFLEKPIEDASLLQAVRGAVDHSMRLNLERRRLADLQQRLERLTARERSVFELITSGLLNKQAGAELGITEKTVKVHRAEVMAKMGARSFAELVKFAHFLNPAVK